jgi:hypothetical protein
MTRHNLGDDKAAIEDAGQATVSRESGWSALPMLDSG